MLLVVHGFMRESPEPPVARVDPVREERFGVPLADPYRWMEAEDGELADWLAGQGSYTASRLAGLPGRAAFRARVEELTAATTADSAFRLAADRVFFQRQAADAAVPVLMAAEGHTTRVLLDPTALAGREHSHLDWYVPSPDGRYVACGISQGGSESSTLRVLNADTGELLPDAIPGAMLGAVSWVRLPEGEALLYHRYLDPPPGTAPDQRRRDSRACLHRIGTTAGDDLIVLARGVNPLVPLSPVDRPLVFAPGGSDWLLALISHASLSRTLDEELSDCTLYVAPRAALADPAACPWRRVAGPDDGVTAYAVHGDDLYLVSHKDAPRSRVLAVSMAAPDLGAEVVLPGGERAVAAVKVIGDHLLVHERDGGLTRLRRVPLGGGESGEVTLPVAGFLHEWTAHPARPEAFFVLSSWIHAPRLYRYDGATVADTGWLPPSPTDLTGIAVSDLRVPARDGTLIPLRVVHRAALTLDGTSPAILSGYGSYGVLPYWGFAPEMLAWYERGGIYAEAGLRGGGEYGREWHEAGSGPHKENTITDFIDCAEYLVSRGYTCPSRLAGEGASAGAIPVGGALVRRPDLFGAMVLQVPSVNKTRAEFGENGPVGIPEFGTVTTEAGLRDLLIVDCYLRVEDGTPYPAVLLTVGLNDPRVAIWQPSKMTARLQAATTSGRPILLRVDPHAGHGFGSTRAQRVELTADMFAFLMDELERA
jgi:prolyl oligopeptidase